MADENRRRRLFLGCFIALVATAFGFAVRGAVLGNWADQFHLTEEQKGIIDGVGTLSVRDLDHSVQPDRRPHRLRHDR